ncbi:unnamed protein product [Moneuplotes crassus]|uniref:Uncharacterized protein n=1 Tax=Euplotes crassus TaxID=5936 RepID=A0AAD1U2I0_EUPCR|nr:unnamed protein product [Moneuplotes crassus]
MKSSKKILTNINYISHIIKYYGYLQECANLFRRLCKKSQSEWDQNQKAIINVIMKTPEARTVINIGHIVYPRVLDFLIKGDKFNYYAIECTLYNKPHYKNITKFLNVVYERNKELGISNPKLFSKIKISYKKSPFWHLGFVKRYFELGFDLSSIQMDEFEERSGLFREIYREKASECVYIDTIKTSSSLFIDLYPQCETVQFDMYLTHNIDVFLKKFEILELHSLSLNKLSEIMAQLDTQNIHCNLISFDHRLDYIVKDDERENIDPNKLNISQNLSNVLNYFPNVTAIKIKQENNDISHDAFQIMTQSRDNITSSLANINSLYFNTCQDKNEKVLHINKSKVEFIVKIHSDTSGYDEFYVLQADSFEYYCESYDSFYDIDDILILKSSYYYFYQFKIKNYRLLYTEKEALQHERYSEYIKKLSGLKDLKVADICLIGVTERILKSKTKSMVISSKLSNYRPHYYIEAFKCTGRYPFYDCINYDKLIPVLQSLKEKLVSLYFRNDEPNYRIYGRTIFEDENEPNKEQASLESKEKEDFKFSQSDQEGEDSECAQANLYMGPKCKNGEGDAKFIKLLDELDNCHLLEFKANLTLNNSKKCEQRLLKFLKDNTNLRELKITTSNTNFPSHALKALAKNHSLRSLTLH